MNHILRWLCVTCVVLHYNYVRCSWLKRKTERDTHKHKHTAKKSPKNTRICIDIDTNVDRHRSSQYSIWKKRMIRYEIQNNKKSLQEVCCCSAIIIKFIMFEAFIVHHVGVSLSLSRVCVCVCMRTMFFSRQLSVTHKFVCLRFHLWFHF